MSIHIICGIEIATYDRGKLGKTEESSPITDGKYTVAQLYNFVKGVNRDGGGLKYTAQEASDYLFPYAQKEDGTKYSLKREKEVNIAYDAQTESVSPQYSLKTWNNSPYKVAQKELQKK